MTHCTKKGADRLAENAPEFVCPICLPKPKSSGFQCKKASLDVLSPFDFPSTVSRDIFDKNALKVAKRYELFLKIDVTEVSRPKAPNCNL